MKRLLPLLAALSSLAFAAFPLSPFKAPASPIKEISCKTEAEARALFTSNFAGSKAVTVEGPNIILPVAFKSTEDFRAVWDLPLKLDLTTSRGIEFDLYVTDIDSISSANVYFHSGDGWFTATIQVPEAKKWTHITVPKSQTHTEDKPAGWEAIDTLRISFWKGDDKNDALAAVTNFGRMDGTNDVLVIRADSCIRPGNGENKSYITYTTTICSTCEHLGLAPLMISDFNISDAILAPFSVAILPYNPSLPEGKIEVLKRFVARGGKLIAFYACSDELRKLIGLTPGVYTPIKTHGGLRGMRATARRLPGQPDLAPQASHNISLTQPLNPAKARIIANWEYADGTDSGMPAVIVTDTGAYFSHVWYSAENKDKDLLLMALFGNIQPDVYKKGALHAMNLNAQLPQTTIDSYEAFLQYFKDCKDPETLAIFNKAKDCHDRAAKAIAAEKYAEAIALLAQGNEAAQEAWCRNRPSVPKASEFRGIWCHSASGPAGKTWDEAIRFVAESGFNAILPNMCWGATAFYPSKVLEVHPSVATKGDQIALCLAACKKYNVKCHIWRVCWNTGACLSKEMAKKIRDEGRALVYRRENADSQGRPWLCPSNPVNQQLNIDAMLELVRNYPEIAGIHFDYIRYPGGSSCFCKGCRERFEARIGHPVANWPDDVDKKLREEWLQFRRDNITKVVKTVHEEARKIRKDIQISAALFPQWHSCRVGEAQDWELWCRNRWLDFICPMNYNDHVSSYSNISKQQKAWAHDVPSYPGIGLSCWADPHDAVNLSLQIQAARDAGFKGFTVFALDGHSPYTLPIMKLGTTRQ